MTLLHVHYALRNQQAFQRLLERDRGPIISQSHAQSKSLTGTSTSAGKSWTRKHAHTHIVTALELNAVDQLGRTVLHLACSSTDPASVEYVRLLLGHPAIQVNVVDKESHWTALHRAMYAGNIEAAVMLLKRADTDTSIKDNEGYTAFDLYNATIRTANPTEGGSAELLTWGANRNAALGLGDGNDRIHPDQVIMLQKGGPLPADRMLEERFKPVRVREVSMSKLHTVILTDEPRDNLRLCGFGSGGRLGPFFHTLYSPTSLAISSHTIVSVALGQDHTLALTSSGEVISWGLNRFAQLGYIVESGQGGSPDEVIQTTPRKVSHLKREIIKGVAACKSASACWSEDDVWTWGTNNGQLGYSKAASPVQVVPRKASMITQSIRCISMSDAAMVCLFLTGEVVCVWNGGASKINFPATAFPSDISTVYRPPQAIRGSAIVKVAHCDDSFAALSSSGEVFTLSLPIISEAEGSIPARGQIKPQRVWALRRQWSSVRDVDVGGDGALIVCTQSGHVFVRSRSLKSGAKAFKFQRVAHVQRAIRVCANSTGAFGALRVDYRPPPIAVTGRDFSADMAAMAPYVSEANLDKADREHVQVSADVMSGADDDIEDASIVEDVAQMAKLMAVLLQAANPADRHGADLVVRVDTQFEVPVHRLVLAARCASLGTVFRGENLSDRSSKVSITLTLQPPILCISGIASLSLLILLHYLYADQVLALWDRRIESCFEMQLSKLGVSVARVKADLAVLARLLDLPQLGLALQSVGKRVFKPSAGEDYRRLFNQAQDMPERMARRAVAHDPLAPDVALHLADKTLYSHSLVLRARSGFFAAFFGDPEWTVGRRDVAGVVDVDMRHLTWRVMRFVLAFVCFGEEGLFETLEFVESVDELLEFMFLVISAANELLLPRLVLLCSQVVLQHLTIFNACYLLTDAAHYHALDLADRVQDYMTANAETLLESRILDDLDTRVLRRFVEHVCQRHMEQAPVTRLGQLARAAMDKHAAWLAMQDIPVPIVPSHPHKERDVSKMSPSRLAKKSGVGASQPVSGVYSPTASPALKPSLPQTLQAPQSMGDDIFAMDGLPPPLKLGAAHSDGEDKLVESGPVKPGWKKSPATPRTDLKSIMAEAENGKRQAYVKPSAGEKPGSESLTSVLSGPSRTSSVAGLMGQRRRADALPIPPSRVPSGSGSGPATPPKPVPSPARVAVHPTRAQTPIRLGMGPVITPTRHIAGSGSGSKSGSPQKSSLGGAWTLPPVQPIAAPTVSSSSTASTTTLSFAEIQRMQAIQGTDSGTKDNLKRSLKEIQEEEQAHQQEANFLRWWAAEEERVRLAMEGEQAAGASASTSHQDGHGRHRGGKARLRKVKVEG